jgi:hypothetical protein
MVLFLGGQEHGKRHDVLPMENHVVVVAQYQAFAQRYDDEPPRLPIDKVIYERQTLEMPGGGRVDLFFPSGWAPEWQMRALRDYLEFG